MLQRAFLHRAAPVPFQSMTVAQITSNGNSWAAAISPDGKYVALLRRETDGRDSLWMRHLPTNSNTQIVPPSDGHIDNLAFGADGNYVYYTLRPTGSGIADMYRVPVLGGAPILVVHNGDSAPSFYTGGARLCFLRQYTSKNQQTLVSTNLDGSDEKTLWSGKPVYIGDPAWSTDGKHVLLAPLGSSSIAVLEVASGSIQNLPKLPGENFEPEYFVWVPDGSGFLLSYRNMDLGYRQIAYLSFPKGEFHALTNDLNEYDALSLSADGKTLGTVLTTRKAFFGLYSVAGNKIATSPFATLQSVYWFDWLDNNRIVVRNNDMSIDVVDTSTQQRSPVFSANDFYTYDLDACGPNTIVFTGLPHQASTASIWAIDVNGGSPRKVSPEPASQYQRCTPEGKWLIYYNYHDFAIHKVAMAGGKSEILVDADRQPGVPFSLTPDGHTLVISTQGAANGEREIDFVSLSSGAVEKRLSVPDDSTGAFIAPDGQNIAVIRRIHGVDDVWLQPITGAPPYQITNFRAQSTTETHIPTIAWSPDGKVLAIGGRRYRRDAILIKQQEK